MPSGFIVVAGAWIGSNLRSYEQINPEGNIKLINQYLARRNTFYL